MLDALAGNRPGSSSRRETMFRRRAAAMRTGRRERRLLPPVEFVEEMESEEEAGDAAETMRRFQTGKLDRDRDRTGCEESKDIWEFSKLAPVLYEGRGKEKESSRGFCRRKKHKM